MIRKLMVLGFFLAFWGLAQESSPTGAPQCSGSLGNSAVFLISFLASMLLSSWVTIRANRSGGEA